METGEKIGRTFRVLYDNIQEENMRRLGLGDIHVKDVQISVIAFNVCFEL